MVSMASMASMVITSQTGTKYAVKSAILTASRCEMSHELSCFYKGGGRMYVSIVEWMSW